MTKWPMVPLGELLNLQRRWVEVDPIRIYEEIGVRCFGHGIFHKPPIDGSTLGNKRVLRIEPGDLVFNNVFAWEGAVAVASEAEAGKIGSHRFVTYTTDQNRCSVDYLRWYFKSEPGLEVLRRVSPGSAGRNRTMSLDQLPRQSIPLPPLHEQLRLVEYLDALNVKLDEANRLRIEADTERSLLFSRVAAGLFGPKRWQEIPLAELLTEDSRNGLGIRPSDSPPGVPILRISAGTSRADAIVNEHDAKFLEISPKELALYRLRKGDLLACRFNGNLHYVGRFSLFRQELPEDRVYPDKLIRFRVNQKLVLPEFVRYAMNSPEGRSKIEAFCTTTAGNIGISAKELKTIPVPVPTLKEQIQIVDHLDQVQELLARHNVEADPIRREIDAVRSAALDQAFNGDPV